MNRHERRRQKKSNKLNQTVNPDLLQGIKLHTNKNYNEAEVLYNRVLLNEPTNYEALRHLGILCQDLKEYERAYNYFMQALKTNPKGFQALSNLATIHMLNKNYDLAHKCLMNSFKINSNYVPTINNLASYYHKVHEAKNALHYAELSLSIQPNNPLALIQYAKALTINNELEKAIGLLEKLNENFPDNDDIKYDLSTAYREIGEFKKANKLSNDVFKKDYKNTSYLLGYIKDKENKLNEEHINFYNERLESEDISLEDKILINYSFFEYFKNKKDYKKAGSHLVQSNDAQYAHKIFDIESEKKFYEKVKLIFSKKIDFLCEERIKKQIPIFVCGMPRSGTTLCEQILSSHSKITGAGELDFLTEVTDVRLIQPTEEQIKSFEAILKSKKDLKSARTQYLQKLAQRDKNNSMYICDKMPHNFIFIGLIKLILPEAKIIYCKRDPMDNCFSLYSHKFIDVSHQYSYNQKILVDYYKLHQDLMEFWLKDFSNDIFVLDNEELVNNQEIISKKLIDFCELDWEKQCLEFHKNKRQVRTASIEQVRQPMNNKSIGAWKKYENYLSEMLAELN
ncbi:sulfotransferase [Pelagibacteraceae bacterium]|nr:sulfotransferase [Pelagibacteraceae bacterium]